MPLKEVALAAARDSSSTARAAGAANTLVRDGSGWTAHNTDVEGIAAALAEHGVTHVERAVVVGSGATARSALLALAGTGVGHVTFMVRTGLRPETEHLATQLDLRVDTVGLGAWPERAEVIVSTVPPESLTDLAPPPLADPGVPARADRPRKDQRRADRPRADQPSALLDVVYSSGPTPLQAAAAARGWVIVPGTSMLLHQAAAQVRLMTGRVAPLHAMREALLDALARDGASPAPPARA
jgi:shikimate dehydrogenase